MLQQKVLAVRRIDTYHSFIRCLRLGAYFILNLSRVPSQLNMPRMKVGSIKGKQFSSILSEQDHLSKPWLHPVEPSDQDRLKVPGQDHCIALCVLRV